MDVLYDDLVYGKPCRELNILRSRVKLVKDVEQKATKNLLERIMKIKENIDERQTAEDKIFLIDTDIHTLYDDAVHFANTGQTLFSSSSGKKCGGSSSSSSSRSSSGNSNFWSSPEVLEATTTVLSNSVLREVNFDLCSEYFCSNRREKVTPVEWLKRGTGADMMMKIRTFLCASASLLSILCGQQGSNMVVSEEVLDRLVLGANPFLHIIHRAQNNW